MTFRKPKVSKEAVAGGVDSMSELLRRDLEIMGLMDQNAKVTGALLGKLVQGRREIGRKLYRPSSSPSGTPGQLPRWISEAYIAEILRNRLAAELAEHSQGGANQSVLGPVTFRGSLVELTTHDHASIEKSEGAPPPARPSAGGGSGEATYDFSELGGLRPKKAVVLDGSQKRGNR